MKSKILFIILSILILFAVSWFFMGLWASSPEPGDAMFAYDTTTPPPGPEAIAGFADPARDSAIQDSSAPANSPVTANDTSPPLDEDADQGINQNPDFNRDQNVTSEPDSGLYLDNDPMAKPPDPDVEDKRNIMLMRAEDLFLQGQYREALDLLLSDEALLNNDTARLEAEIRAAMGD